MTEPQTPSPAWDALPVLTEVVETPVAEPTAELPVQADVPVLVDFDIPDFDFSAEMAQLSEALPDGDLDFPVELTLDEVLSVADRDGEPGLDAEALIGRLPSLDLDVPLPDDMDLGEVLPGFAMPDDPQSGVLPSPPVTGAEGGAVPGQIAGGLSDAPEVSERLDVSESATGQLAVDMSVAEIPVLDEPLVVAEIAEPASDLPLGGGAISASELLPDVVKDLADDVAGALGAASAFDVPELSESAALLDEVASGSVAEVILPEAHEQASKVGNGVECGEPAVAVAELASAEPLPDVVMPAEALPELAALAESVVPSAGSGDAFVQDDTSTTLDAFAFDLGAATGVPPAGVAASYAESLGGQLAQEAPAVPRAYAVGQSISLDSLPTGVLGGGLGPAAVAVTHDEQGVDAESDREVELAWARDLGVELPPELKRHFSRPLAEVAASVAESPVAPLVAPEPIEPLLPESPVLPEPPVAVEDVPPVVDGEVDIALSTVEPAMQLSAVRAVSPPLAVVAGAVGGMPSVSPDVLVEALYARVLPRMKVELALWMQDALEVQAKQLMSGVMQHLKEDFDMMLAEALRESLREAIDEAQGASGES